MAHSIQCNIRTNRPVDKRPKRSTGRQKKKPTNLLHNKQHDPKRTPKATKKNIKNSTKNPPKLLQNRSSCLADGDGCNQSNTTTRPWSKRFSWGNSCLACGDGCNPSNTTTRPWSKRFPWGNECLVDDIGHNHRNTYQGSALRGGG